MYRNQYKHLYFDLDRTLWDFEKNASEAFKDIFEQLKLSQVIDSFDLFVGSYHKHNEDLWSLYRTGNIKKDKLRHERFKLTLQDFNVYDENLAKRISDEYLLICPEKNILLPYAIEALEYLKSKKYSMYVLTNGFKDVQERKMLNCGLNKYFLKLITSESIGIQKPKAGIFEYAINSVNAKKTESIMIGDDLMVDILGAKNYGIDQVFLNLGHVVHPYVLTYEISSLKELMLIF